MSTDKPAFGRHLPEHPDAYEPGRADALIVDRALVKITQTEFETGVAMLEKHGDDPRHNRDGLKSADLTPDLLGALVLYNTPHSRAEYGLVQKYSHGAQTVWVRFSHGDTAAACNLGDLILVVPAVRRQDRDDLMEYRRRVERATVELEKPIDLTQVQDTPAGRALWKAAQGAAALKILRDGAE